MKGISQKEIAKAFAEVGAVPGDTLMFHTSLKSMGYVENGAQTVIDGALDAVAPGGTIAMASLWFDGDPEKCKREDFDCRTSPTWIGIVPETMRRDPRAFRSNHFSHAVCAIGVRAEELTRNHGVGDSAPSPWSEDGFADNSPWGRLYRWNALYAFIGCDMNSCTMKHYIESRYVRELLQMLPENRRAEFRGKLAHNCQTTPWCWYDAAMLQPQLFELGIVRETRLGNARLYALRSQPLVAESLKILRANPAKWFPADFLAWRAALLKEL